MLPPASGGILGRRQVVVHNPDCIVEYDVVPTIYQQPVAVSTRVTRPTTLSIGPGVAITVGPDDVPTNIDTVVTVYSTHLGTRTHTLTINPSGSGFTTTTTRVAAPGNSVSSSLSTTLTSTSFGGGGLAPPVNTQLAPPRSSSTSVVSLCLAHLILAAVCRLLGLRLSRFGALRERRLTYSPVLLSVIFILLSEVIILSAVITILQL